MKAKKLLKTALLAGTFASALAIYSCGGGGGGGSSEATAGSKITGNAIDGYLFASTVFVDCNNNGKLDLDKEEPSGFTFGDPTAENGSHIIDLDGNDQSVENYEIPAPSRTCTNHTIYVTGGYDEGIQVAFGGVLIGEVGKYNNNISLLTSIVKASSNPQATESKLKSLLGLNDIGINYVEEETNNETLRFVVLASTTLQSIYQTLGQINTEVASAIYKNIGNKIAETDTTVDNITQKIIDGTVKGLEEVDNKYTEFDINDINNLKTSLQNLIADIDDEIKNSSATKYADLGPFSTETSILYKMHETVINAPAVLEENNGIAAGRIDITQITAKADNDDTDNIAKDGSFDLSVDFTDRPDKDNDLIIELSLDTHNKNMLTAREYPVNVTVGIKDVPQAVSRRSAIIRFKGINLTIDNSGNVSRIDTNNMKITVDGTDSNGHPIGTPIILTDIDNDLIKSPTPNKIEINVDKLLKDISDAVSDTHPLKQVQLDGYSFRVGVTIQGIPSRPIEGNLSLK